MMRKISYILLMILAVNVFVGCESVDFGDINDNKNGSTTPNSGALLAGAINSFSTLTGRGGLTIPTLYVQYQSQITYVDEQRYAEVPQGWAGYYARPLSNLSEIINIASDPTKVTTEVKSNGAPENQEGVARILRAIIMKRVTDLYGDVAFSQAFQGLGNLTPAYDKQQDLYPALIEELKKGRDLINTSALPVTTAGGVLVKGDVLYGGTAAGLGYWRRLANSVILQMSLQLSKRYPNVGQYAQTQFALALNNTYGVIEAVGTSGNFNQEAWFKYENLVGIRNPWNANRTSDYGLSQEFTDALKGTTPGAQIATYTYTSGPKAIYSKNPTSNRTFDPRMRVYARNITQNGVPYGYNTGKEPGGSRNKMSIVYYWTANSPLPLMTSGYVWLNRAEAVARGWGADKSGQTATQLLQTAITQNLLSLENMTAANNRIDASRPVLTNLITTGTEGTAYIAARLNDATTAPGGILQVIGEEKWKVLYGQAFDAWAEWRRTGYPALVPATDFLNTGVIPRRYAYPTEEQSLNSANYDIGVAALSPAVDLGSSKIWWDQ
jgi:hypothetical protein